MGSELYRGRCKWFNSKKGFGFIVTDSNEELFVHQTEIKADGFRNLAENEEVEFQIEEGIEGRRKAIKVTGPKGNCVKGDFRRPTTPGVRSRQYSSSRNYGARGYERNNDSMMEQNSPYVQNGAMYNWTPYGSQYTASRNQGYDERADYDGKYGETSQRAYESSNGYDHAFTAGRDYGHYQHGRRD